MLAQAAMQRVNDICCTFADNGVVYAMVVSHITDACSRHWGFGLGQVMAVGIAVDEVARVVVDLVGMGHSPYSGRQPVVQ
jgi:hypothetical protein